MKARISVNKNSAYAEYNFSNCGQWFDVVRQGEKFVTLLINGVETDFTRKEVELLHFSEIKGTPVEDTDKFWSAFYQDRSRLLKGAIEQTFPGCFIGYSDRAGYEKCEVTVSVRNLSFDHVCKIVEGAKAFLQDILMMSPDNGSKLFFEFDNQSYLRITLLQ